MNNRGVALIMALLVVTVLSILSLSFSLKTVNDSRLVTRYIGSERAFWSAEAGLAEAIRNLPLHNPISDCLNTNLTYCYNVTVSSAINQTTFDAYRINSTGSLILSNSSIDRKIEAYVKYTPNNPGEFGKAIEVNGELKLAGNYSIDPSDSHQDYANLSFSKRFGISSEKMRSIAVAQGTNYTNPSSPLQDFHNNITWIDIVDPTKQLKIPKTGWNGSGIIIVNGDTDIEGGDFSGIIWVIGKLTITGNANLTGAVISECEVNVTTKVTGTPNFHYNSTVINNTFVPTQEFGNKAMLSWREVQS